VGGCVGRVAEMSIVRNGEELLLKIQQQQLTSHSFLNLLNASKDGGCIFKNKSPKRFNNFNARRLRVI
jgi:hypothetical protein